MNTSTKISLLNRDLISYASLVFSINSLKLQYDIEVQNSSDIVVHFPQTFNFEGTVARRDFIYIDKYKILGLIIDFSVQDENKATIKFTTGADILNHDVPINTTPSANIGTTLSSKLISEFYNTYYQSRIPIVISNTSNRFGTIFSPDGVIEWSLLWRQIKRMYNVNVDVSLIGSGSDKKIKVDIYDYTSSKIIIYVNDASVLNYKVSVAGDQVTRFTAFDSYNNKFTFFLKKDGGITTDSNSTDIVDSFIDRKKLFTDVLSYSVARDEAENLMLGKYDNSIELELVKKRFDMVSNGDEVSIILENKNIITSKVTKKEQYGEETYTVVLGTNRTRLTDKLKGGR